MDKGNLLAYIGGIVRIVGTLLGGYLAKNGLATQEETDGMIGAGTIVVMGVWSIWAKRKALAKVPPAAVGCILLCALMLGASGCAVVSGKAGESHYVGFAFGEKASAQLAGLNVTETTTAKGQVVTDRGVGLDKSSASGEADLGKILGNLLLLGLQSQGIPVKAPVAAEAADTADTVDVVGLPEAPVVYSLDGYGASPLATGEGIYGRPSCARCRAYKTAHPEAQLINIDNAANLNAMWDALRKRGFSATSAALPIVVSADAFAMSAK